jgi:hypothetical protein
MWNASASVVPPTLAPLGSIPQAQIPVLSEPQTPAMPMPPASAGVAKVVRSRAPSAISNGSAATAAAAALVAAGAGNMVIIHVMDEPRKGLGLFIFFHFSVKRDFYCDRDILVREMKYFSEYLSDSANMYVHQLLFL